MATTNAVVAFVSSTAWVITTYEVYIGQTVAILRYIKHIQGIE